MITTDIASARSAAQISPNALKTHRFLLTLPNFSMGKSTLAQWFSPKRIRPCVMGRSRLNLFYKHNTMVTLLWANEQLPQGHLVVATLLELRETSINKYRPFKMLSISFKHLALGLKCLNSIEFVSHMETMYKHFKYYILDPCHSTSNLFPYRIFHIVPSTSSHYLSLLVFIQSGHVDYVYHVKNHAFL